MKKYILNSILLFVAFQTNLSFSAAKVEKKVDVDPKKVVQTLRSRTMFLENFVKDLLRERYDKKLLLNQLPEAKRALTLAEITLGKLEKLTKEKSIVNLPEIRALFISDAAIRMSEEDYLTVIRSPRKSEARKIEDENLLNTKFQEILNGYKTKLANYKIQIEEFEKKNTVQKQSAAKEAYQPRESIDKDGQRRVEV